MKSSPQRSTNLALALLAMAAAAACSSAGTANESASSRDPQGAAANPGATNGPSPSLPSGSMQGAPPSNTSGGTAAGSGGASGGYAPSPTGNTNVNLGGAQDFGFYRRLLGEGRVPETKDFDAAGFFAEHHTKLPPPLCGKTICLQSMLAVMTNLSSSASCTMLQLGLNSNLVADPTKRPPLNLVVSIDVSGSMNAGGKIDFVRSGLEQLVDGLRDVDKLALVTYSDAAKVVYPMADVGCSGPSCAA